MAWPIFTLLRANGAITALVGTNPARIWKTTAPEGYGLARPYIVWSVVGGAPENYFDGVPGIDSGRLQVDVYSEDEDESETLALLVRDTLEPHMHMLGVPLDFYEPDTKLYRWLLEFDRWQPR